jgi:hypothetical protein
MQDLENQRELWHLELLWKQIEAGHGGRAPLRWLWFRRCVEALFRFGARKVSNYAKRDH